MQFRNPPHPRGDVRPVIPETRSNPLCDPARIRRPADRVVHRAPIRHRVRTTERPPDALRSCGSHPPLLWWAAPVAPAAGGGVGAVSPRFEMQECPPVGGGLRGFGGTLRSPSVPGGASAAPSPALGRRASRSADQHFAGIWRLRRSCASSPARDRSRHDLSDPRPSHAGGSHPGSAASKRRRPPRTRADRMRRPAHRGRLTPGATPRECPTTRGARPHRPAERGRTAVAA